MRFTDAIKPQAGRRINWTKVVIDALVSNSRARLVREPQKLDALARGGRETIQRNIIR
jgi:hypothetical protein